MQTRDIMLGRATLPAVEGGGWAIPGGGILTDSGEAMAAAARLAAMLDRAAGYAASVVQPEPEPEPVRRYTRREATDTRFTLGNT